MATRTVLVSDISGEPDAVTATLGFRGDWYELDLTAHELETLERELSAYLEVAREVVATTPTARRFVPETTVEERVAIRAWAREQGYELADRGKIPNAIYRAYQQAHAEEVS